MTDANGSSSSDGGDGAADQGMECTRLTVGHALVIALLHFTDSGSRSTGLVSHCSLYPPTFNGFKRPDHEMPSLQDVRSRQPQARGHPPQVAGAIPDDAQHSRQDTVGRGLANGGEAYANTVDVSSSPCSGEQALGCRILDIVY